MGWHTKIKTKCSTKTTPWNRREPPRGLLGLPWYVARDWRRANDFNFSKQSSKNSKWKIVQISKQSIKTVETWPIPVPVRGRPRVPAGLAGTPEIVEPRLPFRRRSVSELVVRRVERVPRGGCYLSEQALVGTGHGSSRGSVLHEPVVHVFSHASRVEDHRHQTPGVHSLSDGSHVLALGHPRTLERRGRSVRSRERDPVHLSRRVESAGRRHHSLGKFRPQSATPARQRHLPE